MSILEAFHRDQQRVLDRLVDGELGQTERRELLSALDDEPGAWRSCALAFLESQNWRWQLARFAAMPTLAEAPDKPRSTHSPSIARAHWWGLCLAAAASLFLAFGLGTRFPAPSEPTASTPDVQVAAATAEAPAASPSNAEVEPAADSLLDLPGTVTLALAGDGSEAKSIELPVTRADPDSAGWLEELESSMPTGLWERLREAGLDVVRRQRLYGVDLSDGRHLVVPVEQIEIRETASHAL